MDFVEEVKDISATAKQRNNNVIQIQTQTQTHKNTILKKLKQIYSQ
jgi:hypothetical protein